ncbi:MAG TPA: glutamate-5-semialdehyde dehydrogenase [Phycisphaerae bacterium]|nr:glutamate-5-semialdehyde dehydrogenase [Phycisphaerae bacterium]
MVVAEQPVDDLPAYVERLAFGARQASYVVARLNGQRRTDALRAIAAGLRGESSTIAAANERDMRHARESGIGDALLDRLRLDASRIEKMAEAVEEVAGQPDPIGETLSAHVRPDGLRIEKRRVPLGVVAVIYEARPNVTADAAALCLKSGNACILRGGRESFHSNAAIGQVIGDSLERSGLVREAVQIVGTTDRALVPLLLKQNQYIDLVVPRGGEGLIRTVVEQSTIPVIKHYAGNCHVYVHEKCPYDRAEAIVLNAKLQRPAVCNAAETILFDASIAERFLPSIARKLGEAGCEIRGCARTIKLLDGVKQATEQDWYTEYLDLVVAVKIVDGLDEAIAHINKYGSGHTDAILTDSVAAAQRFVEGVDSANTMVNCSTRLSDGGVYGLGAEIGISTDKLHARGPMGASDLTTYKYVVTGDGHTR